MEKKKFLNKASLDGESLPELRPSSGRGAVVLGVSVQAQSTSARPCKQRRPNKGGSSSGSHRALDAHYGPLSMLRHLSAFLRNASEPPPHVLYGEAASFRHLFQWPLVAQRARVTLHFKGEPIYSRLSLPPCSEPIRPNLCRLHPSAFLF